MKIEEAIRSGKPFRRSGWPHAGKWIVLQRGDLSYGEPNVVGNWHTGIYGRVTALDLICDDWEIEERNIECTAQQFRNIFEEWMDLEASTIQESYDQLISLMDRERGK